MIRSSSNIIYSGGKCRMESTMIIHGSSTVFKFWSSSSSAQSLLLARIPKHVPFVLFSSCFSASLNWTHIARLTGSSLSPQARPWPLCHGKSICACSCTFCMCWLVFIPTDSHLLEVKGQTGSFESLSCYAEFESHQVQENSFQEGIFLYLNAKNGFNNYIFVCQKTRISVLPTSKLLYIWSY